MTSPGFSDSLDHALAFAAKYHAAFAGPDAGLAAVTRTANVALLLTRYGCEEATIIAGVLQPLLERAEDSDVAALGAKIEAKFGPVVLIAAQDACPPRFHPRGRRSWRAAREEYLAALATAAPRGLDVAAAVEIHRLGQALTMVRRLGVEYLRTVVPVEPEDTLWWYRTLVDVLSRRAEWRQRAMLAELQELTEGLGRLVAGGSGGG